MNKKNERLGIDLDEELDTIRDYKSEKPTLKSKKQGVMNQAILRANREEAENAKYHEELAEWDETLDDEVDL